MKTLNLKILLISLLTPLIIHANTINITKELPTLSELIEELTDLKKQSINLQENLAVASNFKTTKPPFISIESKIEPIYRQIDSNLKIPKLSFSDIVHIKSIVSTQRLSLKEKLKTLDDLLDSTQELKKQWITYKKNWTEWKKSILEANSPSKVRSIFQEAESTISIALRQIDEVIQNLVSTRLEGSGLQTKIYKVSDYLDALAVTDDSVIPGADSPLLFSPVFFSQFNQNLFDEIKTNTTKLPAVEKDFFQENYNLFIFQLIIFLLVAIFFIKYKSFLNNTLKFKNLTKRPFSAAIIISFVSSLPFNDVLPALWLLVMRIFGWIAFARILSLYFHQKYMKGLVYLVALTPILIQYFRVFNTPLPLSRLLLFLIATGSLILCLYGIKTLKQSESKKMVILAFGTIIFSISILLQFIGLSENSQFLLEKSLSTIGLTVIYIVFAYTIKAFTTSVLSLPTLQNYQSISRHKEQITSLVTVIVNICLIVLFFVLTLSIWNIYDSPGEAFSKILETGFTLGEFRLSINKIFGVLVILISSFLISWTTQTLLIEDIFPKMDMQRGVAYSTARLIHYCIIIFGILLSLMLLGFTMTNITILGGALGLGIGLSLQDIVKNFAAGIILLFERPIKIGDMILLDDKISKVKRIGLRSTIVQIVDGADVNVPNNDLISEKIINWTRSKKVSLLRLPIGIAYGSDVNRAMQIMLETTKSNELILQDPAPRVLFLEFGDNSLNLELQFWIQDFRERFPIRSQINQEIDKAFRKSKIEIPFPQRDLHIKSFDEKIKSKLKK